MRILSGARRDRRRELAPEILESRLNLSTLSSIAAPVAISVVRPAQMVGPLSPQMLKVAAIPLAGATPVGGQASVPIASYSAIANCRIELQAGQSQPDIGYVAASGANVEYTVAASTAGPYSLTLGLASFSGSNVQVLVNGSVQGNIVAPANNSWSSFAAGTATIQLAAGTNVIRLASQNGTQYNIGSIALAPIVPTTSLVAAAPVTPVGSNTSIAANAYSAISNCRLEYQAGVPDIGYVAANGAYAEYTINLAAAGNYTLSAEIAGIAASTFSVSSNGTQIASFAALATGSWQNFTATSQTVSLNAGLQTLRFTVTNNSQYNLGTITLARQSSVTPTPTPTPTPSPTPTTTTPAATVTQRWMTSFNEIDVVVSSGNDSILVTQSGATLTITANGQSQQVAANGELAIWAGSGNDTITVSASVTLDTRLYGGAGNDTLTNLTHGQATIVSIGGGTDTLTGNGINTSYWADSADHLIASTAEQAMGGVHIVAAFYQNAATGTVPMQLNGPNLTDPAAAVAGTTRLSSSSFFGQGPVQQDINQGATNDCYFLTALQSLARLDPGELRQIGVDLGDGTYAIEFQRNGQTQYVRVDGDLPVTSAGALYYNRPGATGDQWASIFEKAYAVFRTGANSYASLDYGFMTPVYNDFGIAASTIAMPVDSNAFYGMATAKFAAGKAVDICTNASILGGAPLIADHTYSIVNTWCDASGTVWVTVRNPWGYDGFSVDSNPSDGLISMTYATLQANAIFGTVMT